MPLIRRVFLDWSQPLLWSSVEQLVEDAGIAGDAENGGSRGQAKVWGLSRWTLVLPVVRAAQRLENLLQQESQRRGMKLEKPKLITVGRLPELIYTPKVQLAGEMQQTLAWTRALLSADEHTLQPLMPVAPPRDPVAPWVEMAGILRRLCEDLAVDGITPGDVVDKVETAAERQRWSSIAKLFDHYTKQLLRAELADPYQQRRLAITTKSCKAPGPIVLIGCVDIGSSTCRMLEAIASDVSLYIGAPQKQEDLFDAYGRVSPGRWNDFHIEIDDEELISAGDANAQAAAAAEIVATWSPVSSSEDAETESLDGPSKITVGITDDAFGDIIETELVLCGFTPYRIGGTVITRTAPGRLLQRISDFLQARTWTSFSALLRHADILDHFAAQLGTATVLTEMDQLRADHFPVYMTDAWPEAANQENRYEALRSVAKSVLAWLEPLEPNSHTVTKSLAKWCGPLKSVIEAIYPTSSAGPFATFNLLVLGEITELLDHLSALPESLDISVSGHAAVEMVLQRLADARSLGDTPQAAVEISGWLDLTLDDATNLIVVGLNQPFVPQAVTADAFLPGNLRARLSVADNERRFARDLYVLQMIHSTRRHRGFIVGRFGPDGSPTPPSRLLAACPTGVTLKRVRRLLETPPADPKPKTRWDRDTERSNLPIPTASKELIPSEISVTAFRSYLECPFRFYLRHVLNLRPLNDSGAELAANQFGDLVHAAVERFGQCADKDLTDPSQIEESLIRHLHTYAEMMYGNAPMAAVRLQITQAEKRLKTFAERQAERIRDGWIIKKAEAAVRGKDGAVIECADGRKLKLKGRIDRIDYHPSTGTWAILDYKTHGHQPLEKHYDKKTKTWIDLQLPLYLLMLKALKILAPFDKVQVGYFNIPDTPAKCGIHLLDFTESFRQSAFDAAGLVAEQILNGNFTPQLDPSMVPFDDYSMILQTGIAENLLSGELEVDDE